MVDSEKRIVGDYYPSYFFIVIGVTYFLLCTPFIKSSFSNSQEEKSDKFNKSEEKDEAQKELSSSFYQIGKASYYSNKFNGRKTASGEIYNSKLYTAAHRSLPFGTKVKVTNLKNGKFVIVKINDRGALRGGRVIDVSRAAAKKLGMIREGVVRVKIEIVKEE